MGATGAEPALILGCRDIGNGTEYHGQWVYIDLMLAQDATVGAGDVGRAHAPRLATPAVLAWVPWTGALSAEHPCCGTGILSGVHDARIWHSDGSGSAWPELLHVLEQSTGPTRVLGMPLQARLALGDGDHQFRVSTELFGCLVDQVYGDLMLLVVGCVIPPHVLVGGTGCGSGHQ